MGFPECIKLARDQIYKHFSFHSNSMFPQPNRGLKADLVPWRLVQTEQCVQAEGDEHSHIARSEVWSSKT